MSKIPTQEENPKGLHKRYIVQKIDEDDDVRDTETGSEYFVMRLDEGGKDPEHIKACRIGVNAYADAIEHHLPELAKDLRERYPVAEPSPQEPLTGKELFDAWEDIVRRIWNWKDKGGSWSDLVTEIDKEWKISKGRAEVLL